MEKISPKIVGGTSRMTREGREISIAANKRDDAPTECGAPRWRRRQCLRAGSSRHPAAAEFQPVVPSPIRICANRPGLDQHHDRRKTAARDDDFRRLSRR